MLQFGTNEVIVGRAASRQFVRARPRVDDHVRPEQLDKSSGIFEAGGTVAETEIWCDARTLQGAYRRGNSVSVGARASSTRRVVR